MDGPRHGSAQRGRGSRAQADRACLAGAPLRGGPAVSDPSIDEVIAIVTAALDVEEVKSRPEVIQFRLARPADRPGPEFKGAFAALARRLERMDVACSTAVSGGSLYVMASAMPRRTHRWLGMSESLVARLLFAAVVAFVMVDGYYRTVAANAVLHIGDPLESAAVYTACLLGILGVHEAGHLAASRWHGVRTSWPFFIPGIPVYGIPTFGAFIRSRGLTVNREILFDIAIAGPVAGLAVAVLVALYGAYEAPVIPPELAEPGPDGAAVLREWGQGEPLLMTAALAAFGKGGPGSEVLLTPVLFAAWIGFLVTFLNMLPAWQLDGGHMARTLLGHDRHRYATYASMGVLVLLGYWFMALLVLALSMRSMSARPLDDVSPLPRSRAYAYVAIVGLAVLCAPLPSSLDIPFL